MTDKAPERIWATGDGTIGSWSASEVRMKIHMPDGWETEYVRADIHQDVVAERDKLKEWQPIETAPTTDEFRCLVYSREMDEVMIGEWTIGEYWASGEGWWSEVSGSSVEWTAFSRPITHWMPLPEPPPEDVG